MKKSKTITEEQIREQVVNVLKEKLDREPTEEEIERTHSTVKTLASVAVELGLKKAKRDEKLAEFPKGYRLEDATEWCVICHTPTTPENNWYDKWGLKCLACQGAIDNKEIPASVATNRDGWYSEYDLQHNFNIDRKGMRKMIDLGILKARTIIKDNKKVHMRLFLLKDNKELLPPKNLVEGGIVEEMIDGKKWYTFRPWYWFVDRHEHLKGYKIMDYLTFTIRST